MMFRAKTVESRGKPFCAANVCNALGCGKYVYFCGRFRAGFAHKSGLAFCETLFGETKGAHHRGTQGNRDRSFIQPPVVK